MDFHVWGVAFVRLHETPILLEVRSPEMDVHTYIQAGVAQRGRVSRRSQSWAAAAR